MFKSTFTWWCFHAKTDRFIFVLPIHLQEYDENAPENGDFLKWRLKQRLGKWSRDNAWKRLCKQQKWTLGEYWGHRQLIVMCHKLLLVRFSLFWVCLFFGGISVTASAHAKASSSSVLWSMSSCAHDHVIVLCVMIFYNPNNVHILQWTIVSV